MIDFHCHIDLYPRPEEVILEAQRRQIYVLAVTTTPRSWRHLQGLLAGCNRIKPALGLHPELALEREQETRLFNDLIAETRYVGEIGLDGSAAHRRSLPAQQRVFESILESCARSPGKILSIHSRGAAKEVLEALERNWNAGKPVFHWFSGNSTELGRAICFDAWFSVGQSMLRTKKGRDLVARMPQDRVLTETDGPFTQTGGRPAMPWDVAETEETLSELWQLSLEDTGHRLEQNLKTLLSHSGS